MSTFSKYSFLAGAMALSFSAAAAFQDNMNISQVESEVHQRAQNNETLAGIIAAASKIPTATLASALCTQGFGPDAVLAAMIAAKRPAADVVAAAVAACGAKDTQIATALVAAGLDPADYLSSTAAGPAAGDVGRASNFSSSPAAATGGGGGRATASPS